MAKKSDTTQRTPQDVVNEILPKKHRLKCKNQKQKVYANLITDKEIVIGTGPAGVGKSYVAIARAIELLQNTSNQYRKIIIINPAVEAEEKHGFIPGPLREKLDPFVGSSIDIIDKIVGAGNRFKMEQEGILSVGALGFLRGKSIDNSILVMEEAQNMSPNQMKTLLTRIGYNSKFIISGDLDQSDRYSDFTKSGLYDALNRHKNIEAFGFMEFDESDIVRNPLISLILDNYKKVVNIKLPVTEYGKPNKNGRIYTKESFDRIVKAEYGHVAKKIVKKNKKKKPKLLRKIEIFFRKNFRW
jgi:phosphate starvation-inducible PhoH-like protein